MIPVKIIKLGHKGKSSPWFTPHLWTLKECTKLERNWRKAYDECEKKNYCITIRTFHLEIKKAQASYFQSKIDREANSPRELFQIVKSLTTSKPGGNLPETTVTHCNYVAIFFLSPKYIKSCGYYHSACLL